MLTHVSHFLNHKLVRGYTLVELAISTTVISMLAVGGLSVLEKKNNSDNISITQERIHRIDKAIKAFIEHDQKGYVPCPALPGLLESDSNFGRSESMTTGGSVTSTSNYNTSTNTCSNNGLANSAGAVPVRTLKLPLEYAYDGWGRQFTYATSDASGSYEDLHDNDFRGTLGVVDTLGTHKTDLNRAAPDNRGAIYVLVSHGANGRVAAYRRNNTTAPVRSAITGIERQNIPGGSSNIFVQDDHSQIFDDIVVFTLKSDVIGDNFKRTLSRFTDSLCYNASEIAESADTVTDSDHSLYGYYNASINNQDKAAQISLSASQLADLCKNLPSVSFSPSNVSGLQVWLDATDIAGDGSKPADGSQLSTWSNKAGNADASATVTPLYIANAINSNFPAISFNGGSQYLTMPALNADFSNYTIFAIIQPDNSSGSQVFLSQDTSTSTYDGDILLGIHANPSRANTLAQKLGISVEKNSDSSDNYINDTSIVVDDEAIILTAHYDGSNLTLLKNGSTIGTTSATGLTLTDRAWNIGRSPALGSHYWDGYIAEIVVYNRALLSNDSDRLYEYFRNKWGISLDGELNNSCAEGLVFRQDSDNPEGSCECPNTEHVYVTTVSSTNACLSQAERNTVFGTCIAANEAPTYNNPPPSTSMELWLDAQDCTSIIVDSSDNVSQWRDKSAPGTNNHHVLQSNSSYQPTYARANETSIDASFTYPFLHFNDSEGDYLASTADIAPETVFIVHRSNSSNNDQYLFDFRTGVTNSSVSNNTSSSDVIGTNWTSHYIDGADSGTVFSDSWQIAAFNGSSTSQDALYLGNSYTGSTTLDGSIAEVIAYSSVISLAVRQNIEDYLSVKWEIPLNRSDACPGISGNLVCTGLQLWLDANNPEDTGIHPADGSSLSTWVDRSGNNNFTAVEAATFESDAGSLINDKPIIHFVGEADHTDGDYYTRSYTDSLNPTSLTLFVAAAIHDHEAETRVLFSSTNGSNSLSQTGFNLRTHTGNQWELLTGNGTENYSIINTLSTITLNRLDVITVKVTDGAQSIAINKGTPVTGSAPFYRNTSEATHIGGIYNNTSIIRRASADVAEIILYDSILDSTDTAKVEDYLIDKWGSTECPGSVCSDLLVWYDANESSTLTSSDNCSTGSVSDGGTVGCWKDRSGNDYHMSQVSSSKRPTMEDSTLNSRPVLRFDGNDDVLVHSSVPATGDSDYTFFAVYKDTPTTAYSSNLFHTNDIGYLILGKVSDTGIGFYSHGNGGWSSYIDDTDTHQIVTWRLQDGDARILLNGVEKLAEYPYTSISIGGAFAIGATDAQTSKFLEGDVAEFIGYTSALSTENRQAIESYLSSEWGIPLDCPGARCNDLLMWWDASDGDTITSSADCVTGTVSHGGSVGCWRDKSGNGYHVMQSTPYNQPTMNANVLGEGKNIIYFDGAAKALFSADHSETAPSFYTAFLLFKDNQIGSGWKYAFYSQRNAIVFGKNGVQGIAFHTGGTGWSSSIDDTDTYQLVTYQLRPNDTKVYMNGVEKLSGYDYSEKRMGRVTALGSNIANTGAYFYGDIAEIVIYSNAFDDTTRQSIENSINAKWGLDSTCPNDHCTDLLMWFDANKNSSLTEDTACTTGVVSGNEEVGCWMDLSGNGYHLKGSTNKKPIYVAGAKWGKPVIRFDGDGNNPDSLQTDYKAANDPSHYTIFTVVKDESVDYQYTYFFHSKLTTPSTVNLILGKRYTHTNFTYFGGAWSETGAQDNNVYQILTFLLKDEDNDANTASTDGEIYGNGDLDAPLGSDNMPYSKRGVGEYITMGTGVNGNAIFKGNIAEFIVYADDDSVGDNGLNDTDRIGIQNYLSQKWNIAVDTDTSTP